MDIIDEFTDRFGEPPKEVVALTKLSLLRALSEKCRIRRTEQKDGRLIFSPEMPDLAAWSEVFEKVPGLMLRGAPTPTVTYRLAKGQKGEDEALKILLLYCRASKNETQGGLTPQ